MIFLEVDLAVYKRLVGYPLDSHGLPQIGADGVPVNREVIGPPDLNLLERLWDEANQVFTPVLPRLPSYGIRIPRLRNEAPQQRGLTTNNQDVLGARAFDQYMPNSFRQVPVFDMNLDGRKWSDVWPCVTFRWTDQSFDASVYEYHSPFQFQDTSSSPLPIINAQGETVQSGYSKNITRPFPDGFKLVYQINAWAKTAPELGLICSQIVSLFPGKGAINVITQDGAESACDMLLTDIVTLSAENTPLSQGEEEQRGLGRGFIYSIDAKFDNTTNEFGVQGSSWAARKDPAIIERLFEIDLLMQGVAGRQREQDLNAFELKPITG